ncbi:Ty1/Copia family ribonuclease HI, partial [Bacillus sp. NTK074B]|uniref:Ty1/Copia family ribonuclease HI n=1 Tax=Bacillus sp. NTK074B TaxID=2802174 RepID=UPI001A8C12D9|nr:Ty1/Copia family ribonuclease HI [Bacillus sp. NTK074B]
SDRKSAIFPAVNPILNKRTKHFKIDCHFIQDAIKDGLIKTVYVPSQHQVADMLTKSLSHEQHSHLIGKLGVLNILHPAA